MPSRRGRVLKPEEWEDERWEKMIAALPVQHGGSAEDVAEAVLFCVHSEFMTGQLDRPRRGTQPEISAACYT